MLQVFTYTYTHTLASLFLQIFPCILQNYFVIVSYLKFKPIFHFGLLFFNVLCLVNFCCSSEGHSRQKNRQMTFLQAEMPHSLDQVPNDSFHHPFLLHHFLHCCPSVLISSGLPLLRCKPHKSEEQRPPSASRPSQPPTVQTPI